MAADFCCTGGCGIAVVGTGNIQRHWNVLIGTVAVETTIVPPGMPASYKFGATAVDGSLAYTIARKFVAARFYIYCDNWPSAGIFPLFSANANGAFSVQLGTTGLMFCKVGAGANSGTVQLTLDTWHRVDVLFDSNTGTGSAKIRVDGGTEQTATNVQTSVNMTSARIGLGATASGPIYIAGFILGTAAADYPWGAGKVIADRPTRDSGHSVGAGAFVDDLGAALSNATTTAWQRLDDPMTGASPFIKQTVNDGAGYMQVGFAATSETGNARSLCITASVRADTTGANQSKVVVNDNGTLVDAWPGTSDFSDLTNSYPSKQYATAPSGGAWIPARVDGLLVRIGHGLLIPGAPIFQGIVREMEYAISAPAEGARGMQLISRTAQHRASRW